MRLFRRIGDIVAANLNDLVDRFEDPEVMLKQAIREMETMIEDATAAAARAIAGERLLARDLSDHQENARRWEARAEEAVRNGDDELGRQAIARALEHQAMLADTRRATFVGRANRPGPPRPDPARCGPSKPRPRRKLASLSARRQMVDAGRALRESTMFFHARSQRLCALRTNVSADRPGRCGGPGPCRTLRVSRVDLGSRNRVARANPARRGRTRRNQRPASDNTATPLMESRRAGRTVIQSLVASARSIHSHPRMSIGRRGTFNCRSENKTQGLSPPSRGVLTGRIRLHGVGICDRGARGVAVKTARSPANPWRVPTKPM